MILILLQRLLMGTMKVSLVIKLIIQGLYRLSICDWFSVFDKDTRKRDTWELNYLGFDRKLSTWFITTVFCFMKGVIHWLQSVFTTEQNRMQYGRVCSFC
jgi:hypothetical protein